ncbi:GNAT family N-acetyltransferase, partial [Streptomyces sclerotialus]|uniref:GNAT family N-acetyltransferase n=1 Tax=Streptomyces sclerotialus TaxID=1957 RepID=UPI0004C4DC4D
MINIAPSQLPAFASRLAEENPCAVPLAEHVLLTGIGRWRADRIVLPRTVGVSCAGHVLLRGVPDGLTPEELAPWAGSYIDASARFLPLLGTAFDRLTPWERMVWTQQAEPQRYSLPRGVTVRRLGPADAHALTALGPDAAWLTASWGGPRGLAASGHCWAALNRAGRILAVACTYFRGTRYEEVAAFTTPDHRRHRLALACVAALSADIASRGHTPSWNCSVHHRASRLLAWTAGFRLVHEYVHYAVGDPVARGGHAEGRAA